MDELRTLPFGAVWEYYCLKMDVPPGESWINDVLNYEKDVTDKRM